MELRLPSLRLLERMYLMPLGLPRRGRRQAAGGGRFDRRKGRELF